MTLDASTYVVRSSDSIAAIVGEELVMFSMDTGRYYGFNTIATVIWQHIEEPITVAALCAKLQHLFDVTTQQCDTEVLEFLQKLEQRNMLRIVE
jgi:hypothetical protein